MNAARWVRPTAGILATVCLVSTRVGSAQGERITIQLMPTPNQVVRYHSVQEIRFTLPSPGPPADPSLSPPASGAIVGTTDSVHTVTMGAPDAQGHAEARFTYDQFTMQMSINGQTLPVPFPADTLLRQPITAIVDRDGGIIDLKGSDENAALVATMKPLLASALAGPPSVTLAPGETTTTPLSVDVALPLPGASASLALTGEMTYTLVSLEAVSTRRIAHLTTTFTGRVVTQDIQTPASTMSMSMTMAGDGTLDVDVERGIVTLRKQRQTIDIHIQTGAAAAAPLPPMHMTGLITSTVTAE
jgi:hypothetical protein